MAGKTIVHQASSRSVGSEYSYSSSSGGSSSRTPSPGDYRGSGRGTFLVAFPCVSKDRDSFTDNQSSTDYISNVRTGGSAVVINHGGRHYDTKVGSPDYRTSQPYNS